MTTPSFKLNRTVIGAVHFSPMLGYAGFAGYKKVLHNAQADLKAFVDGGVDSVIFENNYDLPHKIKVGPETVSMMTRLVLDLTKGSNLPFGISVLWNDYAAALSIAKITGACFIRIPVFVDDVQTDFGNVYSCADDAVKFRRKIHAEHVLLLTDIHVKHATLLSKHSLIESAKLAIQYGSDALIITGKWTGDAPKIRDLRMLRSEIGQFPIIVGSGCNAKNIHSIFKIADAAIVSTALKTGKKFDQSQERNIKSYDERISIDKVREFVFGAKK